MSETPIIWITGLPAAGKTTLGRALRHRLNDQGWKAELLDGDELRDTLCADLGFSKQDRDSNVARVAYVARLLARNSIWPIITLVSPYRDARENARREAVKAGLPFVEIFLKCPMDVVEARDPKDLYKKARRGELLAFTGISDPYECPRMPELELDCTKETHSLVQEILGFLSKRGFRK